MTTMITIVYFREPALECHFPSCCWSGCPSSPTQLSPTLPTSRHTGFFSLSAAGGWEAWAAWHGGVEQGRYSTLVRIFDGVRLVSTHTIFSHGRERGDGAGARPGGRWKGVGVFLGGFTTLSGCGRRVLDLRRSPPRPGLEISESTSFLGRERVKDGNSSGRLSQVCTFNRYRGSGNGSG